MMYTIYQIKVPSSSFQTSLNINYNLINKIQNTTKTVKYITGLRMATIL